MPTSYRLLSGVLWIGLSAAWCLGPLPAVEAQQRTPRSGRFRNQQPLSGRNSAAQGGSSADQAASEPAAQPQGPQPPEQISSEILSTTQPLDDSQTQAVQAYVSGWSQVLTGGGPPQRISEARRHLLDPLLSQAASPTFTQRYAPQVVDGLGRAVGSDNMLANLNAMIVASQLPTADAADLAITAMQSPASAVRYWAAKVIAQSARNNNPANGPTFSPQQQQSIVAALRRAIPAEQDENALGQMFQALSSLTSNEATTALLTLLEQRVAFQVARIRPGLRADQTAMANLLTRLSNQIAQGGDADAPLRGLTAVAAQYARVLAEALQNENVPEDLIPIAVRMIGMTQDVFSAALDRFDPSTSTRPQLLPLAQQGNYSQLLLNVLAWVGSQDKPGILTESDVNIPRDQMDPPPPRLPESPNDRAEGAGGGALNSTQPQDGAAPPRQSAPAGDQQGVNQAGQPGGANQSGQTAPPATPPSAPGAAGGSASGSDTPGANP